jgi:hypothetical protein
MLVRLSKKKNRHQWHVNDHDIQLYPSGRSCVRGDMRHIRPQQMPPLMVRKAAWRR